MHLKQTRQKSGKTSLSIVESWWDPKMKRSRQRTIENLGYLEDLLATHDDPVAWGKDRASELTLAKKVSSQAISIELYPAQKIDRKADTVKNIGSALVCAHYAALGIERVLRNHMRGSHASYDLNAVLRLLVCERIVDPGSKRAAFAHKGRYFFRTKFSEDDVYRALDELAAAKDALVAAMNRACATSGVRDVSSVYYDVTNYYFETDSEDELRKKGVSKEHRPSPLVQMGLLQDGKGLPIGYRKFSGNTSDSQTMLSVLSDLKRDHNLKRVVAVADKGLNCSTNIAALVASGDGFVFSQSVRATKSDSSLKAWVLEEKDYVCQDGFKLKSKQGFKTVHLKSSDTQSGKAKDIDIEVKYVAFWSEKYARRARYEREKVLEKARALIAHPSAYTKATSYGAARYIKNLHFNKTTGEIVDGNTLELDSCAIEEEARYDGYYVIVTSETNWDDERIIDTYRELWRIEESFKISKSELKTRPVFVWTPKHIEAHFLICYIALVILRLLQLATGLPCSRIKEEISLMQGINVDANWWVFAHRSDASDRLSEAVGLEELKLKNLTLAKAKEIFAKAAKWELPQIK